MSYDYDYMRSSKIENGKVTQKDLALLYIVNIYIYFRHEILPLIMEEDSKRLIIYLQNKGVLKKEVKCRSCNRPMSLARRNNTKDQYTWKCSFRDCATNPSVTIRTQSIFEGSKLTLKEYISVIFYWSLELCPTNVSKLTKVSLRSVSVINDLMRDICTRYFVRNPIRLGGEGCTVEADESCFSSKPKHNRGRGLNIGKSLWVFGMVDITNRPKVGYMEVVERRNAETLIPIINERVLPGTTIHTDEWRAYHNIGPETGLAHLTVNHRMNFVGPDGVHTQNIENYWKNKKLKFKKLNGVPRKSIPSYLNEYMWRERFGENAFHNILLHISFVMPLIEEEEEN